MLKGTKHRSSVCRVMPLIKSERINALRKQYDVFLEEDKQRKDRNCFILDKLDKMCFNSAAVLIQNRRNEYSNRQLEVCSQTDKRIENVVDYSTQISRPIAPEFPNKIIDESFMLQEISKKYILIPKINTVSLSNHTPGIKSSTDDGSDWMHKYEILNELKKKELYAQDKIHDDENYSPGAISRNDKLQNINYNVMDIPEKDNIQEEAISDKMVTEKTDEGFTRGLQDVEHKETLEEINNIPVLASFYQNEPNCQNLNNSKYDNNTKIKRIENNDNKPANIIVHAESNYDYSKTSIQNEIEECSNIKNGYTDTDSQNMRVNEPTIILEKHMKQEHDFDNIQNESDDINPQPVINLNDSVNEITNDIYPENLKGEHDAQHPVEIINDPEFKPISDVKSQDNTNIHFDEYIKHQTVDNENNSEHSTNQEFINSIPEQEIQAEGVVENSDNTDITSGIEAFDTEQREMFYSEQAQENYEYDQSDITGTYDQNYDANNENYQQNTEYYEGVQTEQAYPDEINEHEETLQHYDQNYDEQYSTYEQENHEQQEYEDPQQNEQLQEHVQPQIDDIMQPELDRLDYEEHNYETEAYVEGQLDHEQGLIEQQITDQIAVENLHIEEKEAEQVVD